MLNLKAFGITDIGNVRKENEDNFLIENFQCKGNNCLLIAVADGVGGAKAGGTASKIAIDTVKEVLFDMQKVTTDVLKTSIGIANKNIFEMSLKDENYRGMATTFTAIVFTEDTFILGHVGDSRMYIVRDDNIKLLTEDHTVVSRLFKDGVIAEEDMKNHPQRNVLSNALGIQDEISIDISQYKIYENDVYVICTDGLYKYIDDNEIKDTVKNIPLENLTEYFVSKAKERGGDDNISVVVVKVVSSLDERETVKIPTTDLFSEKNNRRKFIYVAILIFIMSIIGIYLIFGGCDRYNNFFFR